VSGADYALEPVEALDRAAVDALRRIYEDGFPARLRADFTSLTDKREDGEDALALVGGCQPYGFAVLRRLGDTGWSFLRYFVVDQGQRGRGLGGVMWDILVARLRTEERTMLVFDVEDPAEPGCTAAESQLRSRRVGFYERHGAVVLPVRGYQTPHGNGDEDVWTPMLLMAAPVAASTPVPGAGEALAIASAVYQYRWRLEPGHPRVTATQVSAPDSRARTQE